MYFYEIHEGDEDLMTDVIVARDTAMSREDFFALVEEIRTGIEDSFEEATLVEAIAAELERDHDFIHVSDERIVASVRIAPNPAEDALIPVDEGAPPAGRPYRGRDEDEDEEDVDLDAELDELPDYVTIVADLEPPTHLS